MNMFEQSGIFFFISSVGFVTLWILGAIFLVYLIRTMKTLSRIMSKIENDVDKINGVAHDILLDIEESALFRFVFGKKRRGHTK